MATYLQYGWRKIQVRLPGGDRDGLTLDMAGDSRSAAGGDYCGRIISRSHRDALRGSRTHTKLPPQASGVPGRLVVAVGTITAPILLRLCSGVEEDQLRRTGSFLLLTSGFALAGFVDDMLGGHSQSGFAGHLGALRQGVFTTGMFKVVFGGAISLGTVELLGPGAVGLMVVLDAMLIALSANLVNLLDRRPGRATKGFLLGFALLGVWLWTKERASGLGRLLNPAGSALGAAIAFFPSDLRERAMLGDTGSNVLGAALGYGMLQLAPAWRVAVLAALVWLTLVSERRSFGEIEGSNCSLLDGLGR